MFMMVESQGKEYRLIDRMINELTHVLNRIETLEASAEENRAIQEELRKSEAVCRRMMERLPHRVFFKDSELHYVFCNDAYARDFGIRPEEIRGKSDRDLFPADLADRRAAGESEILRSGNGTEVEETYAVSGRELAVFATKTPLRSDDGDIMGLLVVLRDVTEDKRREENQALRFKDLEDLLARERAANDTLRKDLENMTALRDRLEAEFKGMQQSMTERTALLEAEREKLKNDLERETAEKKDAVELLRNSFMRIQDLMNSVQHLMKPPGGVAS